jgi:Mg-chelatase subunit ChlD
MGSVIAQAKAGATLLVKRLSMVVPRLRIGLVTYKDGPYVALSLTPDAEAFAKALRKIAASGGGDVEEGVDQGVRAALRQEAMGWSHAGWRVLVVIGDAPPHAEAVPGLERFLRAAREDVLYDHPVIVHTVSTDPAGVDHFGRIAFVGGGCAVTLSNADRLVEEIVALTLGAEFRDRVAPWLEEVERIRRETPP